MLTVFFHRWSRLVFAVFVLAAWIAAAFVIAGCTLAADAITPRIGPELARAVGRYCQDLTQAERELVRASLNAQLDPHRIAITCAGDEPVAPGSATPLLLEIPLPAPSAPRGEPLTVHLRL